MKPMISLLTALLLVTSAASAKDLTGEFDRSLNVTGPVELQVGSGSGSIVVRAGASDRVHIHARFRASSFLFWSVDSDLVREIEKNPPIRQTGNRVVIGTDVRNWNRVGISYEIETPADTRLRVGTGSGSLDVSGIRGPVTLSTGSGGVTASRIGGGVDATAGSGSIRIDGADGPVRATTGSGGIVVADVGGDADITAGSGSLRVTAPRGAVRAKTGSGGIKVEGAGRDLTLSAGSGSLQVDGDPGAARWRLETGSGSVDVRLPLRSSFEVDAHSGSGGVHTKHSIATQGTIRKNQLKGVSGTGVAQLYIRTGSGSIGID